jgi:O-antigen/teichoic acid export membrane protein
MAAETLEALPDRRQLGGRAAGAIVDQFVVAGTSFVLMILVRKQLGSAALGNYVVLITAMILITSMQTAWVGDSLTVLNRFERGTRTALVSSQLMWIVIAIGAGAVLSLPVEGSGGALLFGCMVAIWITEEMGRRLLMVRQEFWQLVLNDVVYAIGAFLGVAVLRVLFGRYSVTIVVGAMAVGAAASVLAALIQLPRREVPLTRPRARAVREIAPFGAWRAAQMGIRPAALYAVRLLVILLAGHAILGDLEGARLFSQPAMTYVSGIASILLPMYAEDERRRTRTVPVPIMTLLVVVPVVLSALVVIVFKQPLASLLLGHHPNVSIVAILGWLMVAVMFALGQPVANLLIARKKSREIFWVRAADSAIGLTLAIPLIYFVSPNLAPWSLAAGMLVGTLALVWLAKHTERPTAAAPVPSSPSYIQVAGR